MTHKLDPAGVAERLRGLRKKNKLSVDLLCQLSGSINRNSWYMWEKQQSNMTRSKARVVAAAFLMCSVKCSADWILTGEGEEPSYADPDDVPCEEVAIQREVELFKKHHPQAVVFIQTSQCMDPFYKSGDYVGGVPVHRSEYKNYSGQPCIVEFKPGKPVIRRFSMGTKNHIYNVYNPVSDVIAPTAFRDPPFRLSPISFHRRPLQKNSLKFDQLDEESIDWDDIKDYVRPR